jgi:hypothetical protein
MRRATSAGLRFLPVIFFVALAGGCRAPSEKPEGAASLSDDQYVAAVAALSVAVHEGLSGEAARARAAELGGGEPTRAEIEETESALARDPEHWAALSARIDQRVREMEAGGASEEAERPSQEGTPQEP